MAAAVAAAVRPFAGSVPRRAAPAPTDGDGSERGSGMKPPRVPPARGSSVCLAGGVDDSYVASQKHKMTCLRNNFVETAAVDTKVSTVGSEMSSARVLLQKRLASELDVLRGLLTKAELISRRGACNGGAAATAGNGNRERFLASNSKQRSEPTEGGGGANAPTLKRRKMPTLVEEKQVRAPSPRMSAEERRQFVCRLSSLSGEVPGPILEFLLKQLRDADANAGGEMEINIDSVEDSVLFEMKAQLDKFTQERPIVVDVLPKEKGDEKLSEESTSKGVLEQDVKTGSRPGLRSSSRGSDTGSHNACKSNSDELPALREEALPEQTIATPAQAPSEPPASGAAKSGGGGEAKKAQDVQRTAPSSVPLTALIYRAKVRRELMEMEKAVLPDERIHPWDLQRLRIAEYGHPSLMQQLGLFLKADDA